MIKSRKALKVDLAGEYRDIKTQFALAELIKDHLDNPLDIRNIAFKNLDISNCRNILDIGCGFGFFTRGLKGKVLPDAIVTGIDVHSEYEKPFLESCDYAGLEGRFYNEGIERIKKLKNESFDLIISSYSLYFFPEYIPQFPPILSKNGVFVSIIHECPHMIEITAIIKSSLQKFKIKVNNDLPYVLLVKKFCNNNGLELLNPWFNDIQIVNCKNNLLFNRGEDQNLRNFFKWKRSFFFPEGVANQDKIYNHVIDRILSIMDNEGEFRTSKNDVIYICKGIKE